MKRCLLATGFLLFLFCIAGAQKVEVTPNGLFLKNKRVSNETTKSAIETLLGKPDRVSLLANTIWTYDKLGIYLYFSPQDSVVNHIGFDLAKQDMKFSPASSFRSSIIIQKHAVNKSWSLARLKKIKSLRFEESPAYLKVAYTSNLKMFFEFDDTTTLLRYIGISLVRK